MYKKLKNRKKLRKEELLTRAIRDLESADMPGGDTGTARENGWLLQSAHNL